MSTPDRPLGGSTPSPIGDTRRRRLLAVLVVALILVPSAAALAAVINTDRYIVAAGQVERENVYVAALAGVVDGRIEGDLVIATGDLHISGDIEGDVLVVSRGRVTVTGDIRGSLRGVARSVEVSGSVGEEVAVATMSLSVPGMVARDILAMGAKVDVSGRVGRDVLGRAYDVTISGTVGRDLHMSVRNLTITSNANIAGDAIYKSRRTATIAPDATINGNLIDLPAGAGFFVAVVLRLLFLLGFFGYLVLGVTALWLFRRTGALAVRLSVSDPLLCIATGVVGAVVLLLLVAVLGSTLVGIPLALMIIVVIVAGLLVGTVPAVTGIGLRILGSRGGDYGGFVGFATGVWLMSLVWPLLGAAGALVLLAWGSGAWLRAIRELRPFLLQGPMK